MKDVEVIFTERNIHFKYNDRSVVMDAASKSLMEMYSLIVCQNGGKVLDVGFGMGYSANKMSELADHYTCIEINPQIYAKALEWAKDKLNVSIIYGDWKDIIPTLQEKFDGIFMDTHHDPNYLDFESTSKLIAKEGCILSIFNYFTLRPSDDLNSYEYRLDSRKFTKLVPFSHTINWTYFTEGEFRKGSNKIKTYQKYVI